MGVSSKADHKPEVGFDNLISRRMYLSDERTGRIGSGYTVRYGRSFEWLF